MLAALRQRIRRRPPMLEVGRGALAGQSSPAGSDLTLMPSVSCQTRLDSTCRSAANEQALVALKRLGRPRCPGPAAPSRRMTGQSGAVRTVLHVRRKGLR